MHQEQAKYMASKQGDLDTVRSFANSLLENFFDYVEACGRAGLKIKDITASDNTGLCNQFAEGLKNPALAQRARIWVAKLTNPCRAGNFYQLVFFIENYETELFQEIADVDPRLQVDDSE